MSLKANVTLADGSTVEATLPDGFMGPEQVTDLYVPKTTHQAEISKRDGEFAKLRTSTKGLKDPAELLKDEEWKGSALKAWGIDPTKGGAPSAEQIAQLRSSVEKEFAPKLEENEALRGRIGRMATRDLHLQILNAARAAGVKEAFLNAEGDAQAPIIGMLAPRFGLSDQHDEWFVRQGETFAVTTNPKSGKPYQTVGEFVQSWAKDKAVAAAFLDPQSQRIGGPGNERQNTGKDVVITAAQGADHATYKAAKAQAEKQGGRVIIEG